MNSSIHPSIHPSTPSFIGSLIHWSLAHGFTDPFTQSSSQSLTQWSFHSLVHSCMVQWFIDSLNHWILGSYWFIGSLLHWFAESLLIHWFIDPLNNSCSDSLVHCFSESPTHWFIDSWIHCFTDSLIHWFIDSLVHALSCARILSCHFIGNSIQPPLAHSLMHLTTSTAHVFCLSQKRSHRPLISCSSLLCSKLLPYLAIWFKQITP